jgi:pyrroloquinoline quinone biosynthesis protein E
MAEPCRSCSRREIDFGGCRCQAMLVTGDPAATDPVCRLSADRGRIDAVLERIAGSASDDWIYRPSPKSRRR